VRRGRHGRARGRRRRGGRRVRAVAGAAADGGCQSSARRRGQGRGDRDQRGRAEVSARRWSRARAAFARQLLGAADQETAINLVDPTWSGELPATFLYDRTGKIVFSHKGRIKPDELRAAIEQALSAKPQETGAQK
jgi:hypothetical protein